MKLHEIIKWNDTMQKRFSQIRDRVSAHRQQKRGIAKHHDRSRSAGHGHTVACNLTQATVLSFDGIICNFK